MNIDPKNIACFGFTLPRKDSWYVLLHKVPNGGWKNINEKLFEDDLQKNVVASY